jgi:hypothetical protein
MDKMLDHLFARGIMGAQQPAASAEAVGAAALFAMDLFLPGETLGDLRYRIAHNGQVMPMLPMDCGWRKK